MKNNIIKMLKRNNMTQKELAEKLNTTEVSISRYINGERMPKISTCIKMAKVLGCDVNDLYHEESELDDEKETNTNKLSTRIINKIDESKCLNKNELRIVEIALVVNELYQEVLEESIGLSDKNKYNLKYRY